MLSRKYKNRYKLKSVASLGALRLCVFRSCKHVSAQVINADGDVMFEVSSSSKKSPVYLMQKKEKAKWVGQEVAKKIDKNSNIYFDRGKYMYHGVVKIVAESAREFGVRL